MGKKCAAETVRGGNNGNGNVSVSSHETVFKRNVRANNAPYKQTI